MCRGEGKGDAKRKEVTPGGGEHGGGVKKK